MLSAASAARPHRRPGDFVWKGLVGAGQGPITPLNPTRETHSMSKNKDEKTQKIATDENIVEERVPCLVVLSGQGVGTPHRLTRPEMIIGREHADIVVAHPTVSRRHAQVTVSAEGVFIEDLESTNGTFVGVERLKGRRLIEDGENIGLGIYTMLRLTYSPAVADALRQLAHDQRSPSAIKVDMRVYLLDVLRSEFAYARRHGSPLTLVFFRADGALEHLGQSGGEALLERSIGRIATAVDATIRAEDFLARSDDDELVALIRGDAEAARALAERVRARIALQGPVPPEEATVNETVSAAILPIAATVAGPSLLRAPIDAENLLVAARAMVRPAMVRERDTIHRLPPLKV
jgi:pSer/pThr/pTyr-binding forkhead associated (FHA) protein